MDLDRTPDRLRAWLDRFVGERHLGASPRRHATTADLVGETFVAAGLEVTEQPVQGPFGTGRNIIGRRPGVGRPGVAARTWIVGAHYDTIRGTPGADDNGVAVAALLEAAQWLGRQRTRDTIELVAWDFEELQTLTSGIALGSSAMAREAKRSGREIGGVFDLEMIGCCRAEAGSQRFPPGFGLLFPQITDWVRERDGRGDFLAVVTNPASSSLAEALAASAEIVRLPLIAIPVHGVARLIPDFYRSDHASFWRCGYPAVMVTDSADFRNEHYHRASDTLDTLDFDFAARVLATVLATVGRLAGDPDAPDRGP